MAPAEAFFRDVADIAFWRGIAPGLHVERLARELAPPPAPPPSPHGTSATGSWPAEGYLRIDGLLNPSAATGLAGAIGAIRAHDMHPTFVYVYDEAWAVLDALLARLGPWLGPDVEALADVWAWHVDPRTDPGGWPMHRGWYEDVKDAAGVPRLVNAWISLTPATERNACMHVVPMTRDPHLPHALRDLSGLGALGVPLPTAAGSGLAWSANSAHWGGSCDPSFSEPRVSMSFTLRRAGYAAAIASVTRPMSFRQRLDLIAEQFVTYGARELLPERPEVRWAAMIAGMAAAVGRGPLGRPR